MGRTRGVMGVLASILAVGALTAAGASASGPHWVYCGKAVPKNTGAYTDKACSAESPTHEGKYELLDGIGKGKGFKGKTEGGFVLHGVVPPGEIPLQCEKASISGSYVAPNNLANVHIIMSKCEYNIHEDVACSMTSTPLSGELGWINQAKGEAGIKLTSEAEPETGLIGEVQGCLKGVKQRWRGSAIGRWGPLNQVTKESTFAFTAFPFPDEANKRFDERSNPPAFEGEEGTHILRSEVNGPESGSEWTTAGGNAGAFDGQFHVKGEALMVR
jgi:hypothetical protein